MALLNGELFPVMIMSNVNNNKGDFFTEKNREGIKSKSYYSKVVNTYNPTRKRLNYESSELFNKVKHQLNNYLEKIDNFKSSSGRAKENCTYLGRNLVHNNGSVKKFHKEIFSGTLPDALNEKEKCLLKFLIKREEAPINRNIFLTRTLQQHLHDCLMDITMKVGIKSEILDLIKKCPIINDTTTNEYDCDEKSEYCEIFLEIPNIKFPKQVLFKSFENNRRELMNKPDERNWNCGESSMVFHNNIISTVSFALLINYCTIEYLFETSELLENREAFPLEINERLISNETDTWLNIQYVLLRIPQTIFNIELMHYSLEYFENKNHCFCQQEIDFSYQPNYYNHLLHLYLGLKHQNN